MQFTPSTTPVAVELYVFPKVNHPVIFGISWFAEFNPQADWHNHSISLNLDEAQQTVVLIIAAHSFDGIDLYNAD